MNNLIIVISGPSGSGKSEVVKRILKERKDVSQIATYTTRKPRDGEENSTQYNFISHRQYLELLKNNQLMAGSKIDGEYYGAPILDDVLKKYDNQVFLMDIGVTGGFEIKDKYPETVMIYLIPLTENQLLSQRGNRGKSRQARAKKQIERILSNNKYEWLVKNDIIEETVQNVMDIIDYEINKPLEINENLKSMKFRTKENLEFLQNFYNEKTNENRDEEER